MIYLWLFGCPLAAIALAIALYIEIRTRKTMIANITNQAAMKAAEALCGMAEGYEAELAAAKAKDDEMQKAFRVYKRTTDMMLDNLKYQLAEKGVFVE